MRPEQGFKADGPSFCHYCHKQLQFKKGGGFHFTSLLTPVDRYPVRLHVNNCPLGALREGYTRGT